MQVDFCVLDRPYPPSELWIPDHCWLTYSAETGDILLLDLEKWPMRTLARVKGLAWLRDSAAELVDGVRLSDDCVLVLDLERRMWLLDWRKPPLLAVRKLGLFVQRENKNLDPVGERLLERGLYRPSYMSASPDGKTVFIKFDSLYQVRSEVILSCRPSDEELRDAASRPGGQE